MPVCRALSAFTEFDGPAKSGKEVITVKYEKPEVVLVAPALDAIQGALDKGEGSFDPLPTDPAYSADEQ